MTNSKRVLVGWIVALLLTAVTAVPAFAGERVTRPPKSSHPITIQCDPDVGHCPCPGAGC